MTHNSLQRSVCLQKTMWLTQVCVGEHLGGHAYEFGLSETVAQVCPSDRFPAGGAAKHPPELVNMISIHCVSDSLLELLLQLVVLQTSLLHSNGYELACVLWFFARFLGIRTIASTNSGRKIATLQTRVMQSQRWRQH